MVANILISSFPAIETMQMILTLMVFKIKRRYKLQKKVFEKRGDSKKIISWNGILFYFTIIVFPSYKKKKKIIFTLKVVVGALYTKMEFVKPFKRTEGCILHLVTYVGKSIKNLFYTTDAYLST